MNEAVKRNSIRFPLDFMFRLSEEEFTSFRHRRECRFHGPRRHREHLYRIETRLARKDGMGLDDLAGKVDFVLAFAVVHEMPDTERFFAEAGAAMKRESRLLLAEPRFEVPEQKFADTLRVAGRYGLRTERRLPIRWTRAAVLIKDQ